MSAPHRRSFASFLLAVSVAAASGSSGFAGTPAATPAEGDAPAAAESGALSDPLRMLGRALARNLKPLAFDPEQVARIQQGLTAAATGAAPEVSLAAVGPRINPYLQGRAARVAGEEGAPEVPTPESEADVLYALGLAMGRNVTALALDDDEMAEVRGGLSEGLLGDAEDIDFEAIGPRLDAYLRGRVERRIEELRAAGETYRESIAAEDGVVTTDSGLLYLERNAGGGDSPEASDRVVVHYTGTLPDGTVFDSSRQGPDPGPATFALDRVIPCFSEGIGRMKVGGTSRLVCPPEIAYGERGSPPSVLPGATLTFEVELLGIENAVATDGGSAR